MGGTNGTTSWTLGCAENLPMRVGDVSFHTHAYVVENGPLGLLLEKPFHSHLLTRLEDNADCSVSPSVRDSANPSRVVQVSTRPRRATVPFIAALTLQTHPTPCPRTRKQRRRLTWRRRRHQRTPVLCDTDPKISRFHLLRPLPTPVFHSMAAPHVRHLGRRLPTHSAPHSRHSSFQNRGGIPPESPNQLQNGAMPNWYTTHARTGS